MGGSLEAVYLLSALVTLCNTPESAMLTNGLSRMSWVCSVAQRQWVLAK